ncbi:hypothetical protein [Aliiglaciecola sp. LCG003]|uniref:hypothetical protein n=1 Tax=Aliiglaciecola sp. LCG003 TaxID=3053655 RepID=UPI0025728C27|nr:hypothetical protein [Aliiglaciecola sp. LCG003]WJG08477.1 hypothetical protein QR722_14170 [Aliiglaciecola sp. LCG003]
MTNERLDNDLPNIVLDKEDREAFQKSRAKEKSSKPLKSDNDGSPKSGVSGFWLVLALLLGIAASAGCYWLYQQKVIMQVSLDNAVSRVTELERRLSATGEEMDQSAGALRIKVTELSDKTDELWTQMDKLWASAWRKNQTEINQLSEKLNSTSQTLDKKLSGLESDTLTVSTNLTVLQEQISQQSNELAQLNTQIVALKGSENNNSRQIGDIQAKLVALDQVNGAITRRVAELEKWRRSLPPPTSPQTLP